MNVKGKIKARGFFVIYLTLSALVGPAFFVTHVYADLYRYIDKNGVLHFTNVPMFSDYELYLREGSIEQTLDPIGSYLRIKNPFDPEENIMGGTQYFKHLVTQFNGKLFLALAAYNAGPERVNRCNRIPPIEATENYVEKVMQYYYFFKKG